MVLAAIPGLACAGAEQVKVTVGGDLDTQAGHVRQKSDFRWKTPGKSDSGELNRFAITNSTAVKIKVEGGSDELKYGGLVKFYADTSASKTGDTSPANKTMIFVETPFGRLEGGSYPGATDTMKVSAVEIARAAGGIDGDAPFRVNPKDYVNNNFVDDFVASPYMPVGNDQSPRANGINYYTPSLNGLKFGVSYTPDSAVKGTIFSATNNVTKSSGNDYIRVVEGAVQYENTYGDFYYKAGALYQGGKAKNIGTFIKNRKNLNAWEAGLLLKYNDFSLAGSYGDAGRSGAVKTPGNKYGYSFWNVGVAYNVEPFGMSLTYFESKRAGTPVITKLNGVISNAADPNSKAFNKAKLLSLGADYKLAPGLLPYAEVTHFEYNKAGAVKNNKGQVYLLGTKLVF